MIAITFCFVQGMGGGGFKRFYSSGDSHLIESNYSIKCQSVIPVHRKFYGGVSRVISRIWIIMKKI